MRHSRLVLAALAALMLVATAGCGGGSGEGRPSLSANPSLTASPTRSVTASPSRSGIRPSDESTTAEPTSEEPTSEEPTSEEPTSEEPTSEEPTSAEPTSAEPTSEEPTSEEPTSEEPTSDEPTSEEPTTQEPTSEEPTADAAEDAASEGDSSPWLPILLLALVVAAVVGLVLLARRRSARREWAASLAGARGESEEVARTLAPSLLVESRESRRGGWAVARPRVADLEERLAALARSAPDVAGSTVASDLAGAVGDLRRSLDEEVRAPDEASAVALRAAQDAAQRLEVHLAATAPPSPPGPA